MPRTVPAAIIARRKGFGLRGQTVVLVDILTTDLQVSYWADVAGTFPVKIGVGPTAVYSPWIKSAGPFRRTKSFQTDAGDIVVQNISGNTIDRDVMKLLKAYEIHGALCIVRFWDSLLADVVDEFHGSLGQEAPTAEQVTLRLRQIPDPNLIDAADIPYAETCWKRYKSQICGSVSVNPTCDKTRAACVANGAIERFPGCPNPPPANPLNPFHAPPINTHDPGDGEGWPL